MPVAGSMDLRTPVDLLPGVGPRRREQLAKLELRTAGDLLFHFPRDYRDLSEVTPVGSLTEGAETTVTGRVVEVARRTRRGGGSVVRVTLQDDTGQVTGVWFNQPYQAGRFEEGRCAGFSGTVRLRQGGWEIHHPRAETLGDDETGEGRVMPVYRMTSGLPPHELRRLIRTAVEGLADQVPDVLPPAWRQAHDFLSLGEALRQIHLPADTARLEKARGRLVYEELLKLQVALAMSRWKRQHFSRATPLPESTRIRARILRRLPFTLTDDQERAIREITADLARGVPMNRLLQGDVGTGKTLVAHYAMLLAVAHGCQAVMMVPTEVLARQHWRTLERSLTESRVRSTLLTGTLSAAERRTSEAAIEAGEVDVVIGTQAVLRSRVPFHRLGLVVIDEGHRFGVQQRASLRQSGIDPHYLVLTATPIPRTVALACFGDLDVSTLRQAPAGRSSVRTYLAGPDLRERWWAFVRRLLNEGRQAYVVAPRVEESDDEQVAGAEKCFEALVNGELADFRVGLVHGRLASEEKDDAVRRFAAGETQVLVATSVIEVGIDVPNATLMTIEGGERFGLAQLHQLRGRVSRGHHPAFVCVFSDPSQPEARRRLEAFRDCHDGFELAEIDFRLRGPGEWFGTRQHGLPPLVVADLQRDREVVERARRDADTLIGQFSGPDSAAWDPFRQEVLRHYGDVLDLADVG